MALPVAHASIALGLAGRRNLRELVGLSILALVPDFDFFFVWVLGFPLHEFHRTFSHSLLFALLAAGCFALLRRRLSSSVPPFLVFGVLLSHTLLDAVCTADAAEHGVMLFWPLSDLRVGWPTFVPLYRVFAESPFSVRGALLFTLLELILALPFWLAMRLFRAGWEGVWPVRSAVTEGE